MVRPVSSVSSADLNSVTFVMDAAQRIYPRHFTWKEVGVNWSKIYTLKHNYRNTEQIAAFARTLVTGVPLEDDGELPDLRVDLIRDDKLLEGLND